tara:strand:+ start:246 stop:455 length:210 start_codon:yes stop_codon:yes gene_type:complete
MSLEKIKVANESMVLASVERDNQLAKLIQGNMDNIILLMQRIEKLEENKLELQQKLNVVLKAIDRIDNE